MIARTSTARAYGLSLIILFFLGACGAPESSKQSGQQQNIQDIIQKMTLEQKAELVIGTGMYFPGLPDSITAMFGNREKTMDSSYYAMVDQVRNVLPGAAGFTAEYPDLGVTTQVLADGPAGLRVSPQREGETRTYYCTAFPIATLLASSWDTELVEKVGEAMGNEVLEYNADVLLGPGMNIQRDPLCGRNFEYYSEDPLVTGKMAAAMVTGVQSNGVGNSIKHFAANNQETQRQSVNTIVSERALREIYLRGFEIAVTEAKPWTVMTSYNLINGTYAPESKDLITNILRKDWGFDGYVMTDWGGGSDVVAMMEAGNDLIMPGTEGYIHDIVKAVQDGKLQESVLDENIARILIIMMRSPKQKGYKPTNDPDLKAHAEVTRQAATDGFVLLKNEQNALPLPAETADIAVFGTTSYEFISGGTGSGDVNEAYTISLIDGLKNGALVNDEELTKIYRDYIADFRAKQPAPRNFFEAFMSGNRPPAEMEVSQALADKMAKQADVALITIGRNAGEGGDRKAEPGDFYLSGTEKDMIDRVSSAFRAAGKKVIVILNIGGVIETASWRDATDALLCVWQPGQEAGNSVVDILKGNSSPSGKLAVTFPLNYDDVPSSKNFPGTAVESGLKDAPDLSGVSFMRRVPWQVTYEEDIYVGYRYYTTFQKPVAYPFGYGLTYTNFEYSNMELSSDEFKDAITVSVNVKNTGPVAGREVVQVYLSAPAVKMDKPAMVLVDFGKTKSLAPGETQQLTFTIEPRDLCSFDETATAWVAEAGEYEVNVGASSEQLLLTGKFVLATDLTVQQVTKSLVPQGPINKLFTSK
ncbi:MAG TPA: glycoside hydrolase family 3 C-terminal domain-containing protein [Saprospiraceae bacterium]|nr:glycoside hydrolase family 3 C-terminal domain-containing protein [Saprospiraceae bacterium]